jgi:DNA replication protein DnaC
MAAPSSRLNIRLKPMSAQPINPLIAGSDVLAQLVAIKATKPINITTYAPITQTARETKTVINPVTGNRVSNTYRTRARINKSIENYNKSIQQKVNDAIANVKTIKNPDFVFDKPNMRVIRSDVVFDRTREVKIGSFANKQIVSGVLTGKENVSIETTRFQSFTLNFAITYKPWASGSPIQSFNYTITAGNKSDTIAVSIRITKEKRDRLVQEKLRELLAESPIADAKYINTTNFKNYESSKVVRLSDVLMRNFKILNIDGEEIQNFNNNMGTCVIDFMRYYYKADKYRLKKKLTDTYLDECWKYYIETHKQLTGKTINWRTDGVNSEMISAWCAANKIPMIAMDIDYNQVLIHSPEVRNKDAPSFIFRIHNKHIYPVMDKKIIDSLVQKFGKNHGISKKTAEPEQQVEPTYNIIVIDIPVNKRIDFLVNKMYETNTECLAKNISFNSSNGNLEFFIIGNNKYTFKDETTEIVKQYCQDNQITYTGQTPATFAKKQLECIPKSCPNPVVNDVLMSKGIKDRTHLGLINNTNTINHDTDIGFDINKCYSHCIQNPYEKFITLNFNNNWEQFKGDIKLGLYYVETQDNTLFHGTNIYSTSIVKFGLEQKIITKDNIKYVVYATESLDKDVFHKVYSKYDEISNGNIGFKKLLGNMTVGVLGKTKKTTMKKSITTSIDEAFAKLVDMKGNVFIQNNEDSQDRKYYIYGTKTHTEFTEHNLPIWIQILDDSNIRLYKMGQDIGGEIIYRKTDYLVIRNPKNQILGNEPGQYKLEKLPTYVFNYKPVRKVDIDWASAFDIIDTNNNLLKYNNITSINNSNQWKDVCDYIDEHRTLQIRGMGGVGKSWLINSIINATTTKDVVISGISTKMTVKRYKSITCAYTNMAAENINGTTINKLLGMDISNKISKKQLVKIGNSYELIVVDEISMVPSSHWMVLYEIYKNTNCKFLFVGDWKQIPPIENFVDSFYCYHPLVMKMSGYAFCELLYNENSRCDKKLHDVVIQDTIDLSQFPSNTNYNINISYTNKTRKEVNKKCMERNRGNTYIDIPVKPEDGEDCQPVSIFVGCPVIYRVSNNDMNIMKNKRTTITTITADTIIMADNQTIKIAEFHKWLNVGYCFTVHKFQGQTIDQPFTIWDTKVMDYRLIYTALTRSRKYDYINIAK